MTFEVGDRVYARNLQKEGVVVRIHTYSTGHQDVYVLFEEGYQMNYSQGSRTLRRIKDGNTR